MPEFSFVVDSALLSELGERLVERVHIALAELIKNSYDADAKEAIVKVLPDMVGGYIVEISDDGIGMTLQDVERYWMRIATTNKLENVYSPQYGRPKTGSKGIGRFSCRRLGEHLELITTAQRSNGKYETTHVKFDWKKYSPGTDVTKIKCYGEIKASTSGMRGTKLIIRGKNYEEWTKRNWNALKRQMAVLVANRGGKRRGYKEDPGFNIKLIAPEFEEEVITNPREQLMNAGWGRLDIRIGKDGKLICKLDAKKIGTKQITHKERFRDLEGTTANIAILPEIRDQFRNTSVLSLGNLTTILSEWGGVFVRYRNVRVYPFGEAGHDWLNIDKERGLRRGTTKYDVLKQFAANLEGVTPGRELLNMLSSRAYVGDVEVCSPNPSLFEMKANREGFIGERGISLLRKAIRFGIDWGTIYRDYYIRLVDKEKTEQARREFEKAAQIPIETEKTVEKAVEYVKQEVKHITSQLPRAERKAGQALLKATDAILQSDKTTRQELRHLRLVASASSLLLVFSHEVKSLLGSLDGYTITLKGIEEKLRGTTAQKVRDMRRNLLSMKNRFRQLLDMTSLISVDSKQSRVHQLALADKIAKAVACYELITTKYNIDVDFSGIPKNIKTGKMFEAELYSILFNVLSNSIKSVIAARKKNISIRATKLAEGTRLNIRDNGIGVDLKSADELFVPFTADPTNTMYSLLEEQLNPEDQYIVGTGSGLGLSIVREIVAARRGTVRFCKAKGIWKTNLEILLP